MEGMLQYLLIFIVVGGIALGVSYLRKRFKIGEAEDKLLANILETILFITQTFGFDSSEYIVEVVEIVYEALDFVNKYEEVEDLHLKKKLIMDKTLEICKKRGIDLGDGLIVTIVDRVVDYIIAKEFAKEIE